jgi:hypothetical protein
MLHHHILFSGLPAKPLGQQTDQHPYLLTAGMTTPLYSNKYTHASHLQMINCVIYGFLQPKICGMAIECDDFQTVVFINWAEYKKNKKLQSISSKMPFNICILLLKNYIS